MHSRVRFLFPMLGYEYLADYAYCTCLPYLVNLLRLPCLPSLLCLLCLLLLLSLLCKPGATGAFRGRAPNHCLCPTSEKCASPTKRDCVSKKIAGPVPRAVSDLGGVWDVLYTPASLNITCIRIILNLFKKSNQ